MPRTQDRPNVLLIMADQFRHDHMGSAVPADARPPAFVKTPNLDRIAERGVRFTTCCTNSPVSAPARIGLASGLAPWRLGSLDNNSFLPTRVPTYYQRLRDNGYRVGCVGKLDLAKPEGYNGRFGDRPCVFGWGFTHPEECEGKMHAGSSRTPIGPYTHWLEERGLLGRFHEDYKERRKRGWTVGASHDSVLPADAFEDAYIGRRAAEWIESVPGDFPWHYFVSFVGPHDPFDPPTEYADRCREREMPEPVPLAQEGKPRRIAARRKAYDPDEVAVTRRQYCAAIELIDDEVGRIMAALEKRGWTESTYVVFSSDHGEMLGDGGLYTKSVAYEGALRVPLLVAGPGVAGPEIEGGRVSDALVELIDVNPAICELAGLPPQENLDARSFAPVLRGEREGHRAECVSTLRHMRCIRTDRYKLVENYNDATELYDLAEDPNELTNLAEKRPHIARDLSGRLRARFAEGRWLR